jgi:hypothetical protein
MENSKHAGIRIRNLVDDWNPSAIILFVSIRLLCFLYRLLPGRKQDGWRKTTEVHHRNDEAKFIGSMHNLALAPEHHLTDDQARAFIISRLYDVFTMENSLHYALRWKKHACYRIPYDFVDIMEVIFDPELGITSMAFHPDQSKEDPCPADGPERNIIAEGVMRAYNKTRLMADKRRSIELFRLLDVYIDKNTDRKNAGQWRKYAERMLSAAWVHLNQPDSQPGSRIGPHFFHNQKHSGFGLLNIHSSYSCDAGWLDLWMQFSHIGIDGRAASKLQRNIINAFGVADPNMNFPADFMSGEKQFIDQTPGRKFFQGCGFVDLGSVMQYRQQLNDRFGNVLPVSLLIWALARHQLFKEIKFNMPVDLPAEGYMERTVGFVFIKPEKYFKKGNTEASFREYISSIDNQIGGLRRRKNENYYFLQTAVMTPHIVLESMLKYMSAGLYSFTGEMCVTFMDNLEYAIPSLSDNINTIIAISMVTKNNNSITCVSVRSKTDNVKEMLNAVQDVAGKIHDYAGIS